jgi:RNA polymerase sigma-70 factor (ECF subfamily)
MDAAVWLAEHTMLVHRAVGGLFTSPDDVDDAVQEAAIRIWRYWSRYDPAKGPRQAWACVVARTAALDYRRREARHRRVAAAVAARTPEPWADAEAQVADADLARRISNALTPDERRLLALLTRGVGPNEAAHTLGIPPGTGKTRLHRARLKAAKIAAL